ncbi:secretin N-terminal domain-containing protein [Lacipirellula parvula]|nr:secretin N-terminal domain-containing protein [Lacipirellula parvula]
MTLVVVVAVGASELAAPHAYAQERGGRGRGRGGPGGGMSPEMMIQMRAAQMGQGGPQPGQQPPGGEQPKPAGEKPPEGEKPAEDSKTIKRPTEKPQANAEELKAAPDKDGMVQFTFRGQPWTDVLEWFASVSKKSLDWQELPGDFVNLSTQRRYTIDETRDLLNRTLMARGFTMISLGDVLTVVKIDKIDPSMVRRVEPDDLDDQPPHDFVRTRFPLPPTLEPAKAVEDLKVVLSPTAKVTPLLASKQIQVIDAVANLRDVRDLLYAEQMVADKDVRPRVFGPFKYRRADYIADQVMVVLGLDPSSRKGPMEMQLEQQKLQMAMQMQQQGKDVSKMLKEDGPPVHIAVDKRRNFLLVNAPPAEMDIIARSIEEFDVPESGAVAAADAATGSEELTFKRHSTVSIDPDEVVDALQDLGGLNPLTQMQHDNRSKTIFALATAADHATIESLIDKLDGTGRGLKVIWLSRRTRADQVAGTIKALMVGEKKKEDNSRSRYYWSPWDDNGGGDEEETAAFRIQADVENNRLLLWANDDEYKEVSALLKDLGAVAAGAGSNPNKWRVIDARTPAETKELIERLQQTWSGQNKLNINVAPAAENEAAPPAVKQEPAAEPAPNKDEITSIAVPFRFAVQTAVAPQYVPAAESGEKAVEPAAAAEPTAVEATPAPDAQTTAVQTPPEINITVTPDGRMIISSDDVAALDQLEELMSELEPPKQDFEVFPLANSRASLVSLNLEEYFADELSDDKDTDSFGWWWDDSSGKEEDPATLGKARKLRFIWDSDTNTIIAQNATEAQLEVIRNLIKIYDQPPSEDSVTRRRTDVVPIRYSNAQDIGTAIKEVYRDLLSSKDKEFQAGGREGDEGGRSRSERFSFFGGSSSSSQKSTPMKMSFEGALSIGVDEISNSLIISADDTIWENVRDLAVSLDEKAKPDTVVQVHELRGSLKATDLQAVLNTALARPWQGNKPPEGAASGSRGGGESSSRGGDGERRSGDRGSDRDRGRGDRGSDRGRGRD